MASMSKLVDADEINKFVKSREQDFDRFDCVLAGGQPSAPWSAALMSFNAEYCGLTDGFDANSSYTTVAESSPSGAVSSSTTRQPSKASSVFSRQAKTQSSVMSPPQRYGPQQTFFAAMQGTQVAMAPYLEDVAEEPTLPQNFSKPHVLSCEFGLLMGCKKEFRLDQELQWIEHHCSHMRDKFPSTLICWFCDDHRFVADKKADRMVNFHHRMGHIRTHISGDNATAEIMRPDFNVLHHMHKKGLSAGYERMWDAALRYSELPEHMRLPGGGGHGSASSQTPRTVLPFDAGGRQSPLSHDLRRERRPRRHPKAVTNAARPLPF